MNDMSNRWISVKDRMPEDDCSTDRLQIVVLVTTKSPVNGRKRVSQASRCRWRNLDGSLTEWEWGKIFNPRSITHWMPMPEPAEDEKPEK